MQSHPRNGAPISTVSRRWGGRTRRIAATIVSCSGISWGLSNRDWPNPLRIEPTRGPFDRHGRPRRCRASRDRGRLSRERQYPIGPMPGRVGRGTDGDSIRGSDPLACEDPGGSGWAEGSRQRPVPGELPMRRKPRRSAPQWPRSSDRARQRPIRRPAGPPARSMGRFPRLSPGGRVSGASITVYGPTFLYGRKTPDRFP